MSRHDDEVVIDGGVHDASHYDAPKSTVSRDIVKFTLRCSWNGEIDSSDPDAAQSYPDGVWRFSLCKSDSGAEMEMHCDAADVHVHGRVDGASLLRLQELIEAKGVARLNGHEIWNSAVGELLDLDVSYASGESIHAYAEGGCAALPDGGWNPQWFLEFFHRLKDTVRR